MKMKTTKDKKDSMASGIVCEQVGVLPKPPNHGVRKCVRVKLTKNNKEVLALVPGDGGLMFVEENVLVLTLQQKID